MSILDIVQKSSFVLASVDEAIFDTFLLTLISAPLLWFLVMRRLVVSINLEQEKLAEQTRQNNELRTALDAHALVSIADRQGKIVYANEKFSQVSGYSISELLGQDHRIVNSGVHDKRFFSNAWKTIMQGQTWQGLICNRKKNGDLYWVDSTIMPLLDEEGRPRQYISVRRDITDQKNNEARLKTLKRAVDACSEMIFITDADGIIQYANPSLYSFCGWSEEGLIGQRADIFNSPRNNESTMASLKKVLENGDNWVGRMLCRRKTISLSKLSNHPLPIDSFEFWSESSISSVFNDDGSLYGYVQILRDISSLIAQEDQQQLEKNDVEARLKIAEVLQKDISVKERFDATLNILTKLNSFKDQHASAVILKREYTEAFDVFAIQGELPNKHNSQEQIRSYLDNALHLADKLNNDVVVINQCDCGANLTNQSKSAVSHGHYIVPLSVADTILGFLFAYTSPYPYSLEERLSMLKQTGEMMALAVLRDQAQSALKKARDLAIQASASKSEFLANVSHEIRTPMNGVLGMIELLSDTNLSQTQSELVETAHNSAEVLLEILNDILDFSKLEAGKVEVERISFNLGTLIEEVSTLLVRRAYSKGLELNCFLPVGLNPHWLGDPMRIRQVVTNLIGNAIKFTEKGEVSITLKPESIKGDIHTFRIEIRDTGIGVLQQIQDRLFQPFSQAETATARRFGGTGLGLSICKSLVKLMGGEIGVNSEFDVGSCFWFTLPLTIDHEVSPEIAFDFGNKRILVVDDNATNRMILNHYLGHWGLIVGLVENGQDALVELANSNTSGYPYDLIILDMHMPVMDGLELSRNLKKNPLFENIPRILLSSGALLGDEERREMGLKHTLLKPVRQSQLFDTISDTFFVEKNKKQTQVLVDTPYPDYSHKKILVVEDNKVNQKVLLGILAKFKVTPTIANNGKIALEMLADNTYDLIFMDCQMPVMDGYETTAALRIMEQERGLSRQPIVALTAHAVTGQREKCIAAGMDEYLSKPIRRDQLITTLSQWLGDPKNSLTADTISSDHLNPDQPAAHEIWDEIATLKHLDNDKELLVDMIHMFQAEMSEMIVQLKSAENQKDLIELANIAHAIKGSVGHFCADAIIHKAASLENSARNQETIDYLSTVDNLIDGLNRLMTKLNDYADSYRNQG